MADKDNSWIPKATEHCICAVCGSDNQIEISTKGRHGVPVRNVACADCGLVYVSPRPSPAAMEMFYRSHYRTQHLIAIPTRTGTLAHPGTPEYADALVYREEVLAINALGNGMVKPGDRVLGVGCNRGDALVMMNRRVPIEMHGIEPGHESALAARSKGVTVHEGVMETYDPGDLRFDQIQIFHVLEHLHDPLAVLVLLRSWLKPEGRLVVEVPDVMQPYGGLGNFFQYPHIYSFSQWGMRALLERAGLEVRRIGLGCTLYMVAVPAAGIPSVPRAFQPEMLGAGAPLGSEVTQWLHRYDAFCRLHRLVLHGHQVNADLVCRLLALPGLPPAKAGGSPHGLMEPVLAIANQWLQEGRTLDVIAVLKAGRDGPHGTVAQGLFEKALTKVTGRATVAVPRA